MSDKIRADARYIKKLIREAEAVTDEAIIACSRLRQAMIHARQNPEVPVHAGQAALVRLSQAEANALALSTSLLRTHDELSKVSRTIIAGGDEETNIPVSAIAEVPALQPA